MNQETLLIRPILAKDNTAVASIIRSVLPDFGASGKGFALHDPEVDDMTTAYSQPKSAYYVLEKEGRVIGGAGFAALVGGDLNTCELRKMYFLAEARGLGFGRKMLNLCLEEAKRSGYRNCYLETLERMHTAKALYESVGFRKLGKPLGATGHFGCDAWYSKEL